MEIEVGEYARTNKGKIYTVKGINTFGDGDIHYLVKESIVYVRANEIVKHSKDILDLIEVGDILKYKLKNLDSEYITVIKKYYDTRSKEEWLLINGYRLEQVEVLEILTHEQFERNVFRLEE